MKPAESRGSSVACGGVRACRNEDFADFLRTKCGLVANNRPARFKLPRFGDAREHKTRVRRVMPLCAVRLTVVDRAGWVRQTGDVSVDPYGKFGPLGKYGAYGTVGSVINLVGGIVVAILGIVMIFTNLIPSGGPMWFAVLWVAAAVFIVWRFALIARAVRRRVAAARVEPEPEGRE